MDEFARIWLWVTVIVIDIKNLRDSEERCFDVGRLFLLENDGFLGE
jgi:hypothetical protein